MIDRFPHEEGEGPPSAVVESHEGRFGGFPMVWLVPLTVATLVFIIGWRSWSDRGMVVVVDFDAAHGLGVGDPVRSSGIEIGTVKSLQLVLEPDVDSSPIVRVSLLVDSKDRHLIRNDTSFWIEHPRVDFGGVGGLDTITGSRYVGMNPGFGEPATGPYVGLGKPPIPDPGRGGLRILIASPNRAGMRMGGAVTYRGFQIGRIIKVDLSSDSTMVVSTASIEDRYASIVRMNSRFFSTSGIGFELGFDGLRADLESIESMVAGGVGLATPDPPGEPVKSGTRFPLAERAESRWLEWNPVVDLDDVSGD
mgnify:CR=1 FL=1